MDYKEKLEVIKDLCLEIKNVKKIDFDKFHQFIYDTINEDNEEGYKLMIEFTNLCRSW